jgi:UDP-GlcNAc:undecaprenyl-phosphate GlcNAc-1-phosphate transferase
MSSILDAQTLPVVAVAAGASWALTGMARAIAPRLGLMDRPDGRRKVQTVPVPVMGGAAIYLALLLALGAALMWQAGWLRSSVEFSRSLLWAIVSAGLMCGVGLWDDRHGMSAGRKLLLQVAACLPFAVLGRSVEMVSLAGNTVELGGPAGVVFTMFWLVACVNVINLVDGLDGLAGMIGLIVCLATAGLAALDAKAEAAALALVIAGSLIGFLAHNWPPARIYLGDSGSLLIGFLIGSLSIESSTKTTTGFALAVPLMLVSIPVFDTFMAIVRRKLNGRRIGDGDRAHIHHCLQDRGLTRRQSLLALSGLCGAMAVVTLFSVWFRSDVIGLGLCGGLLVLLIVGRIFGYSETMLFFRYAQAASTLLADTSGVLRTRLMLARMNPRRAHLASDCWEQMTRQVQRMGAVRLQFICRNTQSDSVIAQMDWELPAALETAGPTWQFSYCVPGEQGVQATLSVSGYMRKRLRGQRLVDLFRVFDTFCRNWRRESGVPLKPERAELAATAVLPLPTVAAGTPPDPAGNAPRRRVA